MKTASYLVIVRLFLFLPLTAMLSYAADSEGSKDHLRLKRYEGSEIVKYDHRDYDSLVIPLGNVSISQMLRGPREV